MQCIWEWKLQKSSPLNLAIYLITFLGGGKNEKNQTVYERLQTWFWLDRQTHFRALQF